MDALTCETCRKPITSHAYDCRMIPSEPVHVFDTPECRDEFVDGRGVAPAEWSGAPRRGMR